MTDKVIHFFSRQENIVDKFNICRFLETDKNNKQ